MALDFGQDIFKREKAWYDPDGYTGLASSDITLGAELTVESTWWQINSGSPLSMYDLDLTTYIEFSGTETGEAKAGYVQFDLGTTKTIMHTMVNYSLKGLVGGRLNYIYIQTSTDGTTWTTHETVENGNAGAWENHDFDLGKTKYRYFRLYFYNSVADTFQLRFFVVRIIK